MFLGLCQDFFVGHASPNGCCNLDVLNEFWIVSEGQIDGYPAYVVHYEVCKRVRRRDGSPRGGAEGFGYEVAAYVMIASRDTWKSVS